MKEPRPGAWHGGLWLQASKRRNKMESSGVPVVFQTCETLVLLDRCLGVGPVDFSKRVFEMGCKQDESGTGEGVLTLVKLEKKSNTSISNVMQYLVLVEMHFEFDSWSWLQMFWWWTCVYVSVADRLVSSPFWHGLVWHRFCPQALAEALKVNKTITNIDLGCNGIGNEGAKAWCLARGSVAPGLETVK